MALGSTSETIPAYFIKLFSVFMTESCMVALNCCIENWSTFGFLIFSHTFPMNMREGMVKRNKICSEKKMSGIPVCAPG